MDQFINNYNDKKQQLNNYQISKKKAAAIFNRYNELMSNEKEPNTDHQLQFYLLGKLAVSVNETNRLKDIVEHAILSLPETMNVEKQIIELKYLDGLTHNQIAKKLNYSKRQVIRRHNKAIAQMEVVKK